MKYVLSLYNQYRGLSKAAYVLFFARMITNMGAFIWPLLTLILSRKMGYNTATIALLTTLVGILYLPAQIIGGMLADRFDNKMVIIVLDLLSVTLFISCGFVGINTTMIVLFVIAGVFATMEGPAFEALIAKSTKPFERDRVFSLTYLGMNLGLVLGATIGGFLFENYLSLAFIIDGLTTFSSTCMIFFFVKELDIDDLSAEEKNEYENAEDALSIGLLLKERPPIIIYIFTIILGQFIYSQWMFIIPLHLTFLFNENGALLFGGMTSFNGLVVVVLTPLLTYITRQLSELKRVWLGTFLFGGSFLFFLISREIAMFYFMIFIFTIGEIIASIGGAPYLSKRVPDSHRGRVGSMIGLSYIIGMMLGRLSVGLLLDRLGYDNIYTFIGGVTVFTLVFIYYNLKVDKRHYPLLYKQNK